jgi:hypothetical protein
MKNLEDYLNIADSIECDEVAECDVTLGNNVLNPITEGVSDCADAVGNLYKFGVAPIVESGFEADDVSEYAREMGRVVDKQIMAQPKPKERVPGELTKEEASILSSVVEVMAGDGIQARYDSMAADAPEKGRFWENEIEKYATQVYELYIANKPDTAPTANLNEIRNSLYKEIVASGNNFNIVARVHG